MRVILVAYTVVIIKPMRVALRSWQYKPGTNVGSNQYQCYPSPCIDHLPSHVDFTTIVFNTDPFLSIAVFSSLVQTHRNSCLDHSRH